jgi:TRAP-type C4-dicarboxylate transport system substrate-binding protein
MRLFKTTFVACAAWLCAISALHAQEITLRAGVFVPPTTTYGIPFKRFVDRVNETGKGQIQIRIVGGPEAVPADGQAEAVRSGVLDIASLPPTYYKSIMVEGDAQTLTTMSVAEQRASGAFAMLNALAAQKLNAYYLTAYGPGVTFHIYLTKDIAGPDDLKGLRLRSQPIYNAVFKHFGVVGVTIAAPEVYTALERGVVQGFGWPIWGIQDFGWEKMTKVRVDPGFYNVAVNVLVNKPKFDGLTPAQRKVLEDAAAWFEKDMLELTEATTKTNKELQAKQGIKVVDFGRDFEKTAIDLYWDDLQKLAPDTIAKLKPLLTKK